MRTWVQLGIVAAILASTAAAAAANDYVVTKTADTADGVCDADCSLREAIIAANSNPGPNRVILTAGQVYKLTLGPADPPGAQIPGSGDLDITASVTIEGNGATVDGNGIDRVFDVQGPLTVVIFNNLTITGGVESGFLSFGGGVYIKLATVTFNNCHIVLNSTAVESGERDDGGGIAAFGALSSDLASTALATVVLNNTSVRNNTGATGGGLLCVLCTVTANGLGISGNVGESDGGGVAILGLASTASITSSVLQGNVALHDGGGLAAPVGAGSITVTRSRIAGNLASTAGSGMFNNAGAITASNNWWGCNYGPGTGGAGCSLTPNDVSGTVTTAPYLVLQGTPSTTSLTAPGTVSLLADMTFNSASVDTSAGGTVPNGTSVAFSSTLGVFLEQMVPLAAGKATSIFSAGLNGGSAALGVTVDHQTMSSTVTITAPATRPHVLNDLDGDGLADLVFWRPSNGTWYWLTSSSGYSTSASFSRQWGNQGLGDVPLLADMDGDGIADLIVWRASTGTWYWLTSSTGYSYAAASQMQFGSGAAGDVPLVADMDGDGIADLIVWRASTGTWYWLTSSTGYAYASAGSAQWGNQALGDVPLLADVDGDGKSDLIVWRASSGTWYWLTSSSGFNVAASGSVQWGSGAQNDIPLVKDIDGDGMADLAVYRPGSSTFFYLTSSSGYSYGSAGAKALGQSGDVPRLTDMDGDGHADFIIYHPGTGNWTWLTSLSGYNTRADRSWGTATDIPMVK